MNKRVFFGIFTILFFTALVLFSTGCAKKEEAVQEQPEVAQAEPEEVVFTRDDPGPWAGKEEVHLPQITFEKTAAGLKVTIAVGHEMNAEKPHYIMWIKLLDGEDNLIGEKSFQAVDEKAEAIFEIQSAPALLKAYAMCNLHGLWLEKQEVPAE
jgi:superoxide reductase